MKRPKKMNSNRSGGFRNSQILLTRTLSTGCVARSLAFQNARSVPIAGREEKKNL